MKSSFDEPFSQYGLLAEKVMLPDHRKWVRFKLRNFANSLMEQRVTSDDVIFSFRFLCQRTSGMEKLLQSELKKFKD